MRKVLVCAALCEARVILRARYVPARESDAGARVELFFTDAAGRRYSFAETSVCYYFVG